MSATPASIEPKLSMRVTLGRLFVFGLAPARLRALGLKSALSVADQGLTSGAGFAVNLFLARWLAAPVYGAFAVAYSTTLFLSGFHNVLLLEPLSVFGPAHHASHMYQYFRAQVCIHFLLVGILSGVGIFASLILWLLSPQNPLTLTFVSASVALPFFLFLWLVRRMCYVVQTPSLAVGGSVAYLFATVAGLFFLRSHRDVSPSTVFLLIGAASLFAALITLRRLAQRVTGSQRINQIRHHSVLRENWSYGRWLVGSTVLFSLSSQAQTLLAAGILGLGAAGILRAMQLPSLLVTQVITAVGLLVLPSFSYDFGNGFTERVRKKATLVSFSLTAGALSFAAFLLICDGRTEHLLYGGKYASFSNLMPALALMPIFSALGLGYSLALRALQKPHFDLIANACAAPFAVITAILFMQWWGISGAVASMVLSFAVLNIVTVICFRSYTASTKWASTRASEDVSRSSS